MSLFCYEYQEQNLENLLWNQEMALLDKQFKNGLSNYTQTNCKVTLTDKGYRIYRPPNLTVSTNGNTMWGGLVLKFPDNQSSILQQYHTYIIMLDLEGQSSNACTSIYFANNCGWGGGGLQPSPSNVSYYCHPANFQGKMTCWYKWTINDTIWKTCTSSYSSFVAGNNYISYRDFKYGFDYTSTGELGTDLYITNLRMYDITDIDIENFNVNKNGIINTLGISEGFDGTSIVKNSIINTSEIYEL